MKILIATGIYPPDIGGPATYSKLLFDELPKCGIETEVLTFRQVRFLPKVVRHIVYFILLLIKGFRVDVIYALDPVSTGFPALLASNALNKRFALRVAGDYAWEQGTARFGIKESLDSFLKSKNEYPFFVRLLKNIQKKVALGADDIIVPSKYLKKIVEDWGIEKGKITTIYNAFDPPNNIADKEVLRELMQLKGRIIVSVGRLVSWKGFMTLIEIMPEIIKEFPDARLLIIGSGKDKNSLRDKISELKLEENIILTGQLDRNILLRYIKASDLFVLNTFYEGFSHQILECMALGIPVVTTKVGGNTEIIEHNKNGLLVEYNDEEGLKNNISRIFKDKNLALNIVKNAKTKAKQFNKEVMLQKLTRLFEKS